MVFRNLSPTVSDQTAYSGCELYSFYALYFVFSLLYMLFQLSNWFLLELTGYGVTKGGKKHFSVVAASTDTCTA